MIPIPDNCFAVFHRHLPAMELLICGEKGCNYKFQVFAKSMDDDISFEHPFPPNETIEESIRNIMILAHKTVFELASRERLVMQEEGGHVH